MTHATEPDLGPLTWVKGEIDAALSRAREILDRGAADVDPAGLQFAHTHLHQVRGALAIVGLGGAIIAPLLVFALLAAGLDASTAALGLAGVALMEFLVFGALTMRDLRSPAIGANRQGGVQ